MLHAENRIKTQGNAAIHTYAHAKTIDQTLEIMQQTQVVHAACMPLAPVSN